MNYQLEEAIQEVPTSRIKITNIDEGSFSLDNILKKTYDQSFDECVESGEHLQFLVDDSDACVNCGSSQDPDEDEDGFEDEE